jgi:predicted dehydrogenase
VSRLRVGLLGYGLSGRVFHGPLIAATPGLELTTIVTADPDRRARARLDFPHARVVAGADEMWAHADDHDLVVVASTTGTHTALASVAVDAGLAVVVEKPLAPQVAPARALVDRASVAGVMLTVFHNRRWDAEFLTVGRRVPHGATARHRGCARGGGALRVSLRAVASRARPRCVARRAPG